MSSRGVNKVILVGNCGQDPELKATASGASVVTLSLATSETWKDKQTGQAQEKTEWHRVVFFNRLAEIVGEYIRKGSKVYVEGSLRTRKWQNQQGVDQYTTEIVASEMQMLDTKEYVIPASEYGLKPWNQIQSTPQLQPPPVPQAVPSADMDPLDDDLPFQELP